MFKLLPPPLLLAHAAVKNDSLTTALCSQGYGNKAGPTLRPLLCQ